MQQIDPPRLAWLGGKMYKQSNGGRKNWPGVKREHADAIVENASRAFAKQVEEALKAKAQDTLDAVAATETVLVVE